MKTIFLIMLVFTIMLIASLVTVSKMEPIQKEIWYMTGAYDRDPNVPNLIPSLDYDYGLMYVTVLEIFGITGLVIVGINFIVGRKRK
ncbi:MAG: hypothetical protein ACW9W4_10325 [Candidatus Nitrosopumilus sp. bin_7KS]